MKKHTIFLPDEAATIKLGVSLVSAFWKACIIYLYGEIGTGKTTFCRGLLHALGYNGNVKSPTFTLVESYILPSWTIYHFDLYRISNPEELELIGIQDFLNEKTICLVEWPQRGKGILPDADIELVFKYDLKTRLVQVQSLSTIGKRILDHLILL